MLFILTSLLIFPIIKVTFTYDKNKNHTTSIFMDQPTQVYEAQVSGGIDSGPSKIRKSHRLKKPNKKLQDYVLG